MPWRLTKTVLKPLIISQNELAISDGRFRTRAIARAIQFNSSTCIPSDKVEDYNNKYQYIQTMTLLKVILSLVHTFGEYWIEIQVSIPPSPARAKWIIIYLDSTI